MTMFTPSCTLHEYTLTERIAASCSIGERDSHSSTSGEELDDSDEHQDEHECQ